MNGGNFYRQVTEEVAISDRLFKHSGHQLSTCFREGDFESFRNP